MKVVQLGKFYPPEWGGIELATRNLAEGLAANGHESVVVAFTRGEALETRSGRVTVIRARARGFVSSQPLSLRWILECVRHGRTADILIVHWPNPLVLLPVLLIGRRKVFTYWHADIVDKGLLGRLARPIARKLLRRSQRVFVTHRDYGEASPDLRDFSEKVEELPIGVPDPASDGKEATPDRIHNFVDGRKLVLSVGRLVAYKGFDQLVEAAARLPDDYAVVIAGGGPLEKKLAEQVLARGVSDRVLLAGRVSDAELRALFQQARLYVMASIHRAEAYGIVQIEAMAHALPVVTTEIAGSGVPWVAGHGSVGAIVPVGDAQALAHAIRAVGDSPRHHELRREARARYESLFTVEAMVHRATRILNESLRS